MAVSQELVGVDAVTSMSLKFDAVVRAELEAAPALWQTRAVEMSSRYRRVPMQMAQLLFDTPRVHMASTAALALRPCDGRPYSLVDGRRNVKHLVLCCRPIADDAIFLCRDWASTMRKICRHLLLSGATFALMLPLASGSFAQIITSNVSFPKGATSTEVSGNIRGDQTRDYVVHARAGQTMKVVLRGAPTVFFNVLPPGSNSESIFVGSNEGNSFGSTLGASRPYKIRVYQMRATARRGEAGDFQLAVSVTGQGEGGSAGGSASGDALGGLAGMNSVDAISSRGFKDVDSFSSGNTQ